jgi:hypothetical protein
MNHALNRLDKMIAQAEGLMAIKTYIKELEAANENILMHYNLQLARAEKAEEYAAILEKATSNLSEHFERQFLRAEAAETELRELTLIFETMYKHGFVSFEKVPMTLHAILGTHSMHDGIKAL